MLSSWLTVNRAHKATPQLETFILGRLSVSLVWFGCLWFGLVAFFLILVGFIVNLFCFVVFLPEQYVLQIFYFLGFVIIAKSDQPVTIVN